MLKRIVIGLGIAMVAASAVAAESGSAAGTTNDGLTQDSGTLAARFHELDANGDGVLSRSEAEASSTVASLYESLDTSATIEDSATNAKPDGITLDQFESGMQAAHSGGTVGPAASGGETYKVYPDGSREKVEGTGIPSGSSASAKQKP